MAREAAPPNVHAPRVDHNRMHPHEVVAAAAVAAVATAPTSHPPPSFWSHHAAAAAAGSTTTPSAAQVMASIQGMSAAMAQLGNTSPMTQSDAVRVAQQLGVAGVFPPAVVTAHPF